MRAQSEWAYSSELHNPALQLKMGRCRYRAKLAKQVRLRGSEVATPADGNFAGRCRLIEANSAQPFRAHFS